MKVRLFLSMFFIPLISLVFLVLLILIFSDSPLQSLYFFFVGPFRNIFSFGNMLNAAVPLVFGALGVTVAMKAGCFNLGGEGQIYVSAFVTTVTALKISTSSFGQQFGITGVIIAVVTGAVCAGLLAAFSGFCRAKWNTNELITTFLVSCAVIPVVNYFVTGPFLNPDTSLVSTHKIAENMRLSLILKPSVLNTGIFIALIFVLLTSFFLSKTRIGYEFRMAGKNEIFARYGGINTKFNTVLALFLSGCLYGLAGSVLILGTHHAVIKEFSAGLGWNGLAVALIAGFNSLAVIPASFFLAWLNSGARIAMQNTGLTIEAASIVQAVILLLCTSLVLKNVFTHGRFIKNG